jgi:hypothetical protein
MKTILGSHYKEFDIRIAVVEESNYHLTGSGMIIKSVLATGASPLYSSKPISINIISENPPKSGECYVEDCVVSKPLEKDFHKNFPKKAILASTLELPNCAKLNEFWVKAFCESYNKGIFLKKCFAEVIKVYQEDPIIPNEEWVIKVHNREINIIQ